MAAPRNLVNLKDVAKGYGSRSVLSGITLGVAAGDRIGVVGRNGDGKSTLLRLIAGAETPDAGAIVRAGDLHLALLGQRDELDDARTIREELVGGRADHEWAAGSRFRSVLDGLLGGVDLKRFPGGIDTPIGPLSGGERRWIALCKLLLDSPELLLLDEPTNHLGGGAQRPPPAAVAQGARVAAPRPAGAHGQAEVPHRGGECAHRRRARAARPRRAPALRDLAAGRQGARGDRGQRRVRRQGGAARRDLAPGARRPGRARRRQRLGQDDPAGAARRRARADGRHVERCATVRLAHLSQDTAEIPGHHDVLESLEAVKSVATLSGGLKITAALLCDRFGFRGDLARTLVRDLSGGERRRLQLVRLLMGEPNVLLLDEPTNDLDIDTLTALEDLLDASRVGEPSRDVRAVGSL